MNPTRLAPLALLLLLPAFAGCLDGGDEAAGECPSTPAKTPAATPLHATDAPRPTHGAYEAMGFDGTTWPDLHGARVVILDHGAFDYVFGPAKEAFDALTNGSLEHIAAQDTGDALNRAIREKDAPSFDAVYGLDNAYLGKAVNAQALRPYTPQLAARVNASLVFFGDADPWPATPVDHGYIAVNIDPRAGLEVPDLAALCHAAGQFVTEDPRLSSPGLGFLLATVASYPEGSEYDWHDYWRDLFANGATVTSDWTTAYTQHFTGGYGQYEDGFAGTKPLATSYTTSPAYELYYGATERNGLVLAPGATFHQVETVAIAANARNRAGAEAFVEFTLTDAFQDLHAEYNAMYPVVDGIDVSRVYNGTDPAPGSFQASAPHYGMVSANVERWVREWTDLYEAHQA